MNWDELYINAISQMAEKAWNRDDRGFSSHSWSRVARFIRLRIARRAFDAGMEWQASWGRSRRAGQWWIDDTSKAECNQCGNLVHSKDAVSVGNQGVFCTDACVDRHFNGDEHFVDDPIYP
jgi:hypothetical protein